MLSNLFKIASGLRQGGAKSPVLFNLALESVIQKVPQSESMSLSDRNIVLAYTNDIVIIGKNRSEKSMMEMMNAGENIELKVNMGKKKYIMMTREIRILRHINIGNNRIEQIGDFKYLGVTLAKQSNIHGEINIRQASTNR